MVSWSEICSDVYSRALVSHIATLLGAVLQLISRLDTDSLLALDLADETSTLPLQVCCAVLFGDHCERNSNKVVRECVSLAKVWYQGVR